MHPKFYCSRKIIACVIACLQCSVRLQNAPPLARSVSAPPPPPVPPDGPAGAVMSPEAHAFLKASGGVFVFFFGGFFVVRNPPPASVSPGDGLFDAARCAVVRCNVRPDRSAR